MSSGVIVVFSRQYSMLTSFRMISMPMICRNSASDDHVGAQGIVDQRDDVAGRP